MNTVYSKCTMNKPYSPNETMNTLYLKLQMNKPNLLIIIKLQMEKQY